MSLERLWRGKGGERAAGRPWRLEIAEWRRLKAAKGSRRPETHELGQEPKQQNSTFPLEGTHSTNQPVKARTGSTDSNGYATHQIARHVTFMFRFTIIWESIIVIIREKRAEVIEIIWERVEPRAA